MPKPGASGDNGSGRRRRRGNLPPSDTARGSLPTRAAATPKSGYGGPPRGAAGVGGRVPRPGFSLSKPGLQSGPQRHLFFVAGGVGGPHYHLASVYAERETELGGWFYSRSEIPTPCQGRIQCRDGELAPVDSREVTIFLAMPVLGLWLYEFSSG